MMREESIDEPSGDGNGDLSMMVIRVVENVGRWERESAVETVWGVSGGQLRGRPGGGAYVRRLRSR